MDRHLVQSKTKAQLVGLRQPGCRGKSKLKHNLNAPEKLGEDHYDKNGDGKLSRDAYVDPRAK